MGYRLMVGQRILIPSVLVRVQVAQPLTQIILLKLNIIKIKKKLNQKVDIMDIEAEQTEFHNVMKKLIINRYSSIAFYINTENLKNTITPQEYIKEIQSHCKTIAYDEMHGKEITFDGRDR